MELIDLTGLKFERLTVLERAADQVSPSGRHRVMWVCKCDCGNIKIVNGENLRRGLACSCGCLRKELQSAKQGTHRESDSPLYRIWCAMKARCYNPNVKSYDRYGGRGIFVCDEWREHYENFSAWAKEAGFSEGLTIDRIDNDDGYYPDNCRWVTSKEQSNNRSSNRNIMYNNEIHNVSQWAEIMHINKSTVYSRVASGKSFEEALNLNQLQC